MAKYIVTNSKECENAIISIGMDLIKRAKDISNDLENVGYIDILARIHGGEIVNFDVIKNYNVNIIEEKKDGIE